MSTSKALSKTQQQFLIDLYRNEALSREASRAFKSRYVETASILARRGLVSLDISRSTLRHVAWLTAAGARLAGESLSAIGNSVV